jgi:hypothetical protein
VCVARSSQQTMARRRSRSKKEPRRALGWPQRPVATSKTKKAVGARPSVSAPDVPLHRTHVKETASPEKFSRAAGQQTNRHWVVRRLRHRRLRSPGHRKAHFGVFRVAFVITLQHQRPGHAADVEPLKIPEGNDFCACTERRHRRRRENRFSENRLAALRVSADHVRVVTSRVRTKFPQRR